MTMVSEKVKSKNKTVLVIEDSDDLRTDVIEMLIMEGYTTEGAENGVVGVEQASKHMPDLIICDIMMPELNGYGVLQTLRSDAGTAAIPFIFLTAKTEHADKRYGMVLGADDFLTKPFTAEELLDSIEAQLKKREEQLAAAQLRIEKLTESIALALPHEFRTPLNTVIGFSEMLQSEAQNLKPDQVAGWAGHIHSAGYRLYRVVENYLLYVRLKIVTANQLKVDDSFSMSNIDLIIQSQAVVLSQKIKREDDLVVEIEKAPDVQIKDEHAEKIIEELLDNAFKFSKPGQAVTVKGYNEENAYVLVIEDEGRAISSEQIEQITAFMQFNRDLHEQQGLGLGLALTKKISEIYGLEFSLVERDDTGIKVMVKFKSK